MPGAVLSLGGFPLTTAGPDDRFVLPDLQPRRYELHIVREGLAPRLVPPGDTAHAEVTLEKNP